MAEEERSRVRRVKAVSALRLATALQDAGAIMPVSCAFGAWMPLSAFARHRRVGTPLVTPS